MGYSLKIRIDRAVINEPTDMVFVVARCQNVHVAISIQIARMNAIGAFQPG